MLYHYYGDTVRRIFLSAALVMTVTLPFFADSVPVPLELSIFSIPILVLAAGLTNPHQHWVAWGNVVLAVFASMVFQYYAVLAQSDGDVWYFAVNQILTILFLFAVYYGVKTVRGRWHQKKIADAE